jgi:hypothetical protein
VNQSDPSDYLDLLAYLSEQEKEAKREKRLSRRGLLKLLAAGGTVGAGAAVFGAGFLTRALTETSPKSETEDLNRLVADLLPSEGFSIDARWGGVMSRLVELGVVDTAKFSAAASRSGAPLTDDQQRILSGASDETVRIDARNGRFVLNALWALGIANRNPVLADGPMATLDEARRARLASTAGWTLGREPGAQYLARYDLVPLTAEQQAVLEDVAYNSYRPCCDNPTAFPDCNHGAAALGLAEMAAAEGATSGEIFAALKGFNSFWYPDRYYALAVHFERRGQAWEDVDPRIVLGPQFSSLSGWKRVAAQLQQEGLPGQVPGRSSGCGA